MEIKVNELLSQVFDPQPSGFQLLVALGIILILIALSILLRKLFSLWLRKAEGSNNWHSDELVIESFKKIIVLSFMIIGFYAAIFYLPFSEKFTHIGQKVITVISIVVITKFLARLGSQLLRKLYFKQSEEERYSSILEIVFKILLFIIGGLIILQSIGVSITPMLATLGVGGLAVALALQETLTNLFSGIQILAAKNIQLGDYVQLETGDEGYVVDIGWRSTLLKAIHNRTIVIPNNRLAASTVKNFSKPDLEIAVLIDVGVSYQSDLKKVEQVTLEVAKETLKTVEGGIGSFEPFLRFHTFDAYSINFTLTMRAYTYFDQFLIRHEFVKMLHERYHREGIEIPFPITTLQMSKK